MPQAFVNDYISALYHNGAEIVKDGTRGPGLDVELPDGVRLTVNRWKLSMAAMIQMCGVRNTWQSGQCGDFDGDDSADKAKMRQISRIASTELFGNTSAMASD